MGEPIRAPNERCELNGSPSPIDYTNKDLGRKTRIGRLGACCTDCRGIPFGPLSLQRKLPSFRHEITPEISVRLFFDFHESRILVDMACGRQDAIGPKDELLVAGLARKPDTFAH